MQVVASLYTMLRIVALWIAVHWYSCRSENHASIRRHEVIIFCHMTTLHFLTFKRVHSLYDHTVSSVYMHSYNSSIVAKLYLNISSKLFFLFNSYFAFSNKIQVSSKSISAWEKKLETMVELIIIVNFYVCGICYDIHCFDSNLIAYSSPIYVGSIIWVILKYSCWMSEKWGA